MTDGKPHASDSYPATKASITPTPLLHHALDVVAEAAKSDPRLAQCLRMAEEMFLAEMQQEAEAMGRFLRWMHEEPKPKPKKSGPYYYTTW